LSIFSHVDGMTPGNERLSLVEKVQIKR